jgi:putative restriction endonuclease
VAGSSAVSRPSRCPKPGNSSASLDEMRRQIGRYRKQAIGGDEDPVIGCILIRDAKFFPRDQTVAAPVDFASSIVQGKSYDLAALDSAMYFEDLIGRLLGAEWYGREDAPWQRGGPIYGDPRLARQRLGQQAFQAVVLGAYHRRCAITGDRIQPVLQAAHIRPLPSGGEHRLDNGLLLRSDVHTLFDRGYLAVDPKYRLLVSPRLRSEFGNGEEFYARASAGTTIELPERRADRPNSEFLEWHIGEVFNAS